MKSNVLRSRRQVKDGHDNMTTVLILILIVNKKKAVTKTIDNSEAFSSRHLLQTSTFPDIFREKNPACAMSCHNDTYVT